MGGPAANILLRIPLTLQQEDSLVQWLRSITTNLENSSLGYHFWLREDTFPATVSRCQFSLSLEHLSSIWGDDAQKQIAVQLGYLPAQLIEISSGCNRREDHSTLGQLVLHLAQIYHAHIDILGAITPPLKPPLALHTNPGPFSQLDLTMPEPSLYEISAYVQAIPGMVYEIEYTVVDNRRWVSHIVDIPFFQSWLHHPDFHMIK